MTVLEQNKMIAEYMGYEIQPINPHWEHPELLISNRNGGLINYQPDSDWNQLMEVVEKIENEDKDVFVSISRKACIINSINSTTWYERTLSRAAAETKIQAVYQAVAEYITNQKEK